MTSKTNAPVAPKAPKAPVAPVDSVYQHDLDDAIKALSVDKATLIVKAFDACKHGGASIVPVKLPAKLAGSTEGRVVDWMQHNAASVATLYKAVANDNATKTNDQINARCVSVIKSYVLCKPYLAVLQG